MATAAKVSVDVMMYDDTHIENYTVREAGPDPFEILKIGEFSTDMSIFICTREQAERLFDAISEVTMRWRERDPDTISLDARIAAAEVEERSEPDPDDDFSDEYLDVVEAGEA
jgi:hypothetical protein